MKNDKFKYFKKDKRSREKDERNFAKGIRADRNEKVENWSKAIFNKIFKGIKNHEFTSYFNTSQLTKIETKVEIFSK